jgi:c-di-GMP-related signal transduction protein
MDTFVARQPIFDRRREVYGYELLYRSASDQASFPGGSGTEATKQVVANTLISIGADKVLCGKRAFINLDHNLLIDDLYGTFSPDKVVIEILAATQVDEATIAACTKLYQSGFSIALDDFVPGSAAEGLVPFARVIKIDVRTTSRYVQQLLLRRSFPNECLLVAKKVETQEEYTWVREAGYDLFQGHFFAKPDVITGRDISPTKVTCLRLLRQVSEPEVDCKKTATLVKSDVGFSFKLLRYVNSALFNRRQGIESIDHAVVMLGTSGLRQWAAVAALPILALDRANELTINALVRAQFCDRVSALTGVPDNGAAFLAGLFSHLDAMLDMPLEEALKLVGLSPPLVDVLMERETAGDPLRTIYRLVRDYEAGAWEAVLGSLARLNLKPEVLGRAYAESTFWTSQVAGGTSRKKDTRSKRRYPMEGTLSIEWDDGTGHSRNGTAQLQNISETGMQMCLTDKVPTRATIVCRDSKLKIGGRGIVRYCNFVKGKYVIGVDFGNGTGWKEPLAKVSIPSPARSPGAQSVAERLA